MGGKDSANHSHVRKEHPYEDDLMATDEERMIAMHSMRLVGMVP